VVEGYSWNVVHSGDGGIPTQRLYGTNKEIIKGDSIINGITYKKLWEAEDCDLEKRKLLALIREDVEKQKVYAYNKGAEVLLYDLGAEIGDTIEVLNWLYQIKYLDSTNVQDKEYYFSYLVVDNIDYIEDETYGNLKIVNYHKAGWEHRRVTIYERYGDVTGWTTSSHAEIDGMGPGHVICAFDENDELKLDGKEQTDFDCSFLQTYFKESDDYWYSVTSEKAALERNIVQIDKDSLKLSLSDTVSGGGFAAAGVYNNTFIHDISSYGNYQLVQHDTSLNK
jgi:hypothetical protein